MILTTGMKLSKQLGLENLIYVRCQTIILSYYTLLVIYFDTKRPEQPITLERVKNHNVARILRYGKKRLITSPLRDLNKYNGKLKNKVIISIDLCGSFFQDKSIITGNVGIEEKSEIFSLNQLNESEQGDISPDQHQSKPEMKDEHSSIPFFIQARGVAKIKHLLEFLTLPALTKNAGISTFTKRFKKERNKIMGRENSIARLVKCVIYKKKGFVEFFWHVPATKKYGDKYKYKQAVPNDFSMFNNPKKEYTVGLRILDFFSWLDTYKADYPIQRKDLKDILTTANIQLYSSDPSWYWQGMAWNMDQVGASMYPVEIAPKHWNKPEYHNDGQAFLSKHMQGVMNSLGFYLNQMAAMLNKELEERGYYAKN